MSNNETKSSFNKETWEKLVKKELRTEEPSFSSPVHEKVNLNRVYSKSDIDDLLLRTLHLDPLPL